MVNTGQNNVLVSGAMPHSRHVLSSRVRILGIGFNPANNQDNSREDYQVVGAISSFGVSQSRTLEPVRGIGMGDHIIEMVPGQSEPISLSISRAALAMSNLFQEFGYAGGVDGVVRALKHHRYPVDIKQETLISNIADEAALKSYNDGDLVFNNLKSATGKTATPTPAFQAWQNEENLNDFQNGGFKAVITWYLGCWFEDFNVTYGVDNAVISEESTIKVTDVSALDSRTVYVPFPRSGNSSVIWFPNNNV